MTIEAKVGEDGVLVAKVPDRFKGKTVRISIRGVKEEPSAQWQEIRNVLNAAKQLNVSRKSHEEILREIRSFRESE